jgi:hypothetical protein
MYGPSTQGRESLLFLKIVNNGLLIRVPGAEIFLLSRDRLEPSYEGK